MESSEAQWYRSIARFKLLRKFLRISTWVLLAIGVALIAAVPFFTAQRWWLAATALLSFILLGVARLFKRQMREFEYTFASEIERYGRSPHNT